MTEDFQPIEFQLDTSTPEQPVIYAGPMQPDGRRKDWLGTFSPKYLTVVSDAINLYNTVTPIERDHPDLDVTMAPAMRGAILDIDAHATPYGTGEWAEAYVISAGSLHRALGLVGHSSPKCWYWKRLSQDKHEQAGRDESGYPEHALPCVVCTHDEVVAERDILRSRLMMCEALLKQIGAAISKNGDSFGEHS